MEIPDGLEAPGFRWLPALYLGIAGALTGFGLGEMDGSTLSLSWTGPSICYAIGVCIGLVQGTHRRPWGRLGIGPTLMGLDPNAVGHTSAARWFVLSQAAGWLVGAVAMALSSWLQSAPLSVIAFAVPVPLGFGTGLLLGAALRG